MYENKIGYLKNFSAVQYWTRFHLHIYMYIHVHYLCSSIPYIGISNWCSLVDGPEWAIIASALRLFKKEKEYEITYDSNRCTCNDFSTILISLGLSLAIQCVICSLSPL